MTVNGAGTEFPSKMKGIQGPYARKKDELGLITDLDVMKEHLDLYHIHLHFYESSHAYGLGIRESLLNDLKINGLEVLSSFVLYRINGPHTYWHWQIYTKDVYKTLIYATNNI